MNAEDIVRTLAASDAVSRYVVDDDDYDYECVFCHGDNGWGRQARHEGHDPDCPWRLACEWVETHPRTDGAA